MIQCKFYTLSIPPSISDSSQSLWPLFRSIDDHLRQVQVCAEAGGADAAGVPLSQQSRFRHRDALLFRNVCRCNLPGECSHLLALEYHISGKYFKCSCLFSLLLCISGNRSGKCSSSWSPALLHIWGCLYDPPVYYIVLYLSLWSVRHSVQGACGHHCDSRVGISTEYPFILPRHRGKKKLSFSYCLPVNFPFYPP